MEERSQLPFAELSRRGIFALVALVIIAGALFYFSSRSQGVGGTTAATSTQQLPPLTPATQAELAASHGFQYLVSYTNTGFEPKTLTIKKGETVRFTNNSSEELWVASTGTASGNVYPAGTSTECGQSAFDSCAVLNHGDFWEFTFTEAGTWNYHNNTDTNMTGTIIVQ